ncbi:15249_t:CDS:2, partial [Rhizophagus irregularis]
MEQITLFCLVYGVTPVEDRIFPIHISRNNTIAGLCDMIVEKWHDNYSGENLTLWKMKKIETKSGCFRLDNINQTVLNFIELSKVFPKEKFVDDLDEKENEKAINSLLIKKLANIVSSNIKFYTTLLGKRFSHTRFSYKTMIEELREMDFHISEDTLSKIYRRVPPARVSSPNKNSKKAIEAW